MEERDEWNITWLSKTLIFHTYTHIVYKMSKLVKYQDQLEWQDCGTEVEASLVQKSTMQ